ncbi:putative transcription factor interactor and regulator LIM family [Medicago truncatula]|uniref:GATA type zinc finger transcription factor family protein n=1 Tax=Medicago truncatula TaxID=3880 RepID=A0A072U5A9_MEDTR|nr:GATA type zinc finger transcription factor family protein [Medicago truncatula]RHN43318.1 putative transcription factor interactor and regulator LIM family [Medicago truncatula]
MSFTGTQQKCKVCDKTVHLVDTLSADGNVFHKNCFRCNQCNGLLAMSNYQSIEGVLYCKTHAEQLFKDSFAAKKPQTAGKPSELPRAPSKLSAFFSGTQDKCSSCKKTVYPLEKLTVEGEFYHKSCFRCTHGGCFLSPSSYAALDGFIYCKPHFSQLFKAKGSYSYLSKQASIKKNEEMQQAAAEKTESAPASDTETETKEEQDPAVTQEV